jgi:hypothetical protein
MNCGSEIEENVDICPFCGKSNKKPDLFTQKEKKIQDLEQKVKRLEESLGKKEKSGWGMFGNSNFQPWIFIFPIVFVVLFFVLFFFLIRL